MSTLNQLSNPPNHAPFSPSYSHICSTPISATKNLIAIAGQIGHDSATNTIPTTFLDQVSLALQNVKKCLDSAGAKKTDIISVRQYVVNIADHDYKGRVEIYSKWMDGWAPPSTLIGVQGLATKDFLYEIEVMAIVGE
jgi:enamine deaminase RidA (YjgF/YER057c/UK114 family)